MNECMSPVVSASDQYDHDVTKERPQFRLATFIDEPVYLMFSLDGVDVDLIVEKLDGGNASFVCSKNFDLFYEGQIIGPAVLALQDEGMAVVYPVVKSKNWPLINVEFMEMSENDRQMITRFLAACSGGQRRPPDRRAKSVATT
jgi:hypothetical protein